MSEDGDRLQRDASPKVCATVRGVRMVSLSGRAYAKLVRTLRSTTNKDVRSASSTRHSIGPRGRS